MSLYIVKCLTKFARAVIGQFQFIIIKHAAYVTCMLYRVIMHAAYVMSLSVHNFLSIL